jgi:DegV family protein with EDD domain
MRDDFVFIADDNSDLPPAYFAEHDIKVVNMTFTIDDVVYKGAEMPPKEFYDHIRNGKMPVTAQATTMESYEFMKPFLEEGKDVFYLVFSSGLSGTFNSVCIAVEDLKKEFPGRKIIAVDSLAASMGEGLMIHKLQQLREKGASVEEMAEWVDDNRDHVVHMVAVDDLMHLHRGGRVSKMSAIAGSMLGIKPIIHLDVDGKLKVIDKVRGRKRSLDDVVEKTIACVGSTPNDYFMVSHADCEEDARYVAEKLSKHYGIKDYLINYIGPVIGTHTGTGVVAIFMMGERKKP